MQVNANEIVKVPLILDTAGASFGLYVPCIKVFDASGVKEGKYFEKYEECKDTFIISD